MLQKPAYPEFKFCPKCGEKLIWKKEGERKREACLSCGFIHYVNPTPAAGVLIEKNGKILLVQRKFSPWKGLWQAPAGFVEWGETPEETAIREAEEEAGVKVKLEGVFDVEKIIDDPREEIVVIFYKAKIVAGKPKPGSDAAKVGWFSFDNLPKFGSASHKKVFEKLESASKLRG